jgi:hypothetical protein
LPLFLFPDIKNNYSFKNQNHELEHPNRIDRPRYYLIN